MSAGEHLTTLVALARADGASNEEARRALPRIVAEAAPAALKAIALSAAHDWLESTIRNETLRAEREAERRADEERIRARQAERAAREAAEKERRQQEVNARAAAAYRERMADPEGWAERKAQRQATEALEKLERREAREAERVERERRRAEEERLSEYYLSGQAVRDAVAKFERTVREEAWVEWTDELLASEVALGDGTHVAWGLLTVEQHERRIAMHKGNAIPAMQGLARHAQAVRVITAAGVNVLYEVPEDMRHAFAGEVAA